VLGEHRGQGLVDALHDRAGQRLERVQRRETGGEEELVALTEGHVERPGEAHHHLPAGLGPTGLDEAHVARRGAGIAGQVELALAPERAPVPQQVAEPTVEDRDG
jgi:hypothetical protein